MCMCVCVSSNVLYVLGFIINFLFTFAGSPRDFTYLGAIFMLISWLAMPTARVLYKFPPSTYGTGLGLVFLMGDLSLYTGHRQAFLPLP